MKAQRLIQVLAAAALTISMAGPSWSGAKKEVFHLPKGAKIQMLSDSSARISSGGTGGLNETGTFNCSCVGDPKGSCALTRGGTSIICGDGDDVDCNGTCKLTTTTKGFAGSIMRQ